MLKFFVTTLYEYVKGSATMLGISEWLQIYVEYKNGSITTLFEYVNGPIIVISEYVNGSETVLFDHM